MEIIEKYEGKEIQATVEIPESKKWKLVSNQRKYLILYRLSDRSRLSLIKGKVR